MTPYELEVLLWYYARGEDHPHEIAGRERTTALEQLLRLQMIAPDNSPLIYTVTERGKVYIEAIINTPLPEKRWVMPEGK